MKNGIYKLIIFDYEWNVRTGGFINAFSICPYSCFSWNTTSIIFDASVNGSNGADVVIHHKNAISPPNDGNFEQYYIHHHQIDHNLVIEGNRKFTLINPKWDEPHHVIFLIEPWVHCKYQLELITGQNLEKREVLLWVKLLKWLIWSKKEFIPVSLRSSKQLR